MELIVKNRRNEYENNFRNMHIDCTFCEHVIDLENISVATCGHTFHLRCLKEFVKFTSTGKIKCPVSSCKMKIKENRIIQTCPTIVRGDFTLWSGSGAMDQGNPQTNDQNLRLLCTICNDPVTDPENISVTKCGHIFHYYCVTEFAKSKSRWIKCPMTSCDEELTRDTIIKILPTFVDPQNDDQLNIRDQSFAKKETIWENVFKLIQEKFKDPGVTISNEEALDLTNKIGKLENTQKWKSPFEYKQTSGLKFSPSHKYLYQLCNNCEKKEKEIETLKRKMKNMKQLKTKYSKENKYLKEQKKLTINVATTALADFREADVQKVLQINKLEENNNALQEEIQNLQRQGTLITEELGQAKTLLLEMNKVNENNEALQQEIQTLQRQVVTAREASICNEALRAEIHDFRTRNEELTQHNEQMKVDVAKMKEELAFQDSNTTDFMMKELQISLQNDALVHDLYVQINSLQDDNKNLKRLNGDLQKENDYRWELLMNIQSCAFPGTE